MFGLSTLQLGAVALAAAFFMSGVAYIKGRSDGAALTDAAVTKALAKAEKDTQNAIDELSDTADKARVLRRLCLDRGGVWSFTDNQCSET